MKLKKGISLPHPVLGLGDDISGSFQIPLNILIKDQVLYINVKDQKILFINNDYFESLYEEKKIVVVFKIQCSNTLFSKIISNEMSFNIPCNELSNTVVVESFLIANNDIQNYHDQTFNDDFMLGQNKGIFYVKKGSIVGEGGTINIELTTIFSKGLAGIIEFAPGAIDSPIFIDTENAKIKIRYPKKEREFDIVNVLGHNSSFKNTFFNLFIIPALTQAYIHLIEESKNGRYEELLEEYTWAYIIDKISDDFDKDDDPYQLAQVLLKKILETNSQNLNPMPIIAAFNELKEK